MSEIFAEYGIVFAFVPMIFAFGWVVGMVTLPFRLIKEKRSLTIWDTLPFAKPCASGKAKAVATVIVLLFLCFVTVDLSLAEFLDYVLSFEDWFVTALTVIVFYNWFGCIIYQ